VTQVYIGLKGSVGIVLMHYLSTYLACSVGHVGRWLVGNNYQLLVIKYWVAPLFFMVCTPNLKGILSTLFVALLPVYFPANHIDLVVSRSLLVHTGNACFRFSYVLTYVRLWLKGISCINLGHYYHAYVAYFY
jgi:hypothetical protein